MTYDQNRPLAHLLGHLAESAPEKYTFDQKEGVAMLATSWPAEPPFTDYFQKTWARLGTGKKLTESERQVPENAGPLNTNQLIHRALVLMQEQSPEYLQHFLTYAETLSWLEQISAQLSPPAKLTPRASSTRKPARKTR